MRATSISTSAFFLMLILIFFSCFVTLSMQYECPGVFTNPCWVPSCPRNETYWSSCGSTLVSAESLGCQQKTYLHFKTCGILQSQYQCCA